MACKRPGVRVPLAPLPGVSPGQGPVRWPASYRCQVIIIWASSTLFCNSRRSVGRARAAAASCVSGKRAGCHRHRRWDGEVLPRLLLQGHHTWWQIFAVHRTARQLPVFDEVTNQVTTVSDSRVTCRSPRLGAGSFISPSQSLAGLVRYLVAEAEGCEGAVIYVPRVEEAVDAAGGGNCAVVGQLDRYVADDEQCRVFRLPGVLNFVGSEDHLGPTCRGSPDFHVLYLVTTAAD